MHLLVGSVAAGICFVELVVVAVVSHPKPQHSLVGGYVVVVNVAAQLLPIVVASTLSMVQWLLESCRSRRPRSTKAEVVQHLMWLP